MSEISVSEVGLVTILEGLLVMAGQRCSLHIAEQPDCARFWSVLLRSVLSEGKEHMVRDGILV